MQELRPRLTRRERERPGDQLAGALGLPGGPRRLGGGGEPAGSAALVGTQLGRADERRGGRGVSGARLIPTRRRLQRRGDLLVRGQRRQRLVPGAAVRVLVAAQRRRQRRVRGPALAVRR